MVIIRVVETWLACCCLAEVNHVERLASSVTRMNCNCKYMNFPLVVLRELNKEDDVENTF